MKKYFAIVSRILVVLVAFLAISLVIFSSIDMFFHGTNHESPTAGAMLGLMFILGLLAGASALASLGLARINEAAKAVVRFIVDGVPK